MPNQLVPGFHQYRHEFLPVIASSHSGEIRLSIDLMANRMMSESRTPNRRATRLMFRRSLPRAVSIPLVFADRARFLPSDLYVIRYSPYRRKKVCRANGSSMTFTT